MDGMEQWGHREHVVLDDLAVVVDEMQYLGLCATGAVYHSVNLRTELVEQLLDDRCVGAGGREDELASIDGGAVDGIR